MIKTFFKLIFAFALFAVVITEVACSTNGLMANSEMTPGEKLYRARCGNCHRLRGLHENTAKEWALSVEKYGRKMSSSQKQMVLEYLVAKNQEGA
jgi:mono/diheme cytochrome c family protein